MRSVALLALGLAGCVWQAEAPAPGTGGSSSSGSGSQSWTVACAPAPQDPDAGVAFANVPAAWRDFGALTPGVAARVIVYLPQSAPQDFPPIQWPIWRGSVASVECPSADVSATFVELP